MNVCVQLISVSLVSPSYRFVGSWAAYLMLHTKRGGNIFAVNFRLINLECIDKIFSSLFLPSASNRVEGQEILESGCLLLLYLLYSSYFKNFLELYFLFRIFSRFSLSSTVLLEFFRIFSMNFFRVVDFFLDVF